MTNKTLPTLNDETATTLATTDLAIIRHGTDTADSKTTLAQEAQAMFTLAPTNGFLLPVFTTTEPTTPAAGAEIYARKRVNTYNPRFIDQNGNAGNLQTHFHDRKVRRIVAVGGGSSSFISDGLASVTTGGTPTAVTLDGSSVLGNLSRCQLVTSASAGNESWFLTSSRPFIRGSAAGCGGFDVRFRFSIDTIAAGMSVFVGLLNSTSNVGNADASSTVNSCGFGFDAADTTMQFMSNDASSTCTKVDFGSNFPANTNGAIYEGRMFCLPNASTIYYSLNRLDVAHYTESDTTTDGTGTNIPANTSPLSVQATISNRAVASAGSLGFSSFYSETLY